MSDRNLPLPAGAVAALTAWSEALLATGGSVTRAAKVCGRPVREYRRLRKKYPEFADEIDLILEGYDEELADLAWKNMRDALHAGERWATEKIYDHLVKNRKRKVQHEQAEQIKGWQMVFVPVEKPAPAQPTALPAGEIIDAELIEDGDE